MRNLVAGILLAFTSVAMAEIDTVVLSEAYPSTSTTNKVTSTKTLRGKVQAIAISCETNVTVTITATGGSMSIGGERTILGETAITPDGLYTNVPTTMWTYNDNLKLKTKSSSSGTNTVKAVILASD